MGHSEKKLDICKQAIVNMFTSHIWSILHGLVFALGLAAGFSIPRPPISAPGKSLSLSLSHPDESGNAIVQDSKKNELGSINIKISGPGRDCQKAGGGCESDDDCCSAERCSFKTKQCFMERGRVMLASYRMDLD